MPRYYSDDDEPARRPGLFDEISDEEWEWYAEDFASFIHHTKCSLCSKVKPCLPVHLPFYQEQVFVCPDCIYVLHEQLACFGYFHQIMDDDIRAGKVREEGGDKTSVSFRNVLPEEVIQDARPLISDESVDDVSLNLDSDFDLDSSEESPAHKDDYCAVDFEQFSRDGSVFTDPPPDPAPRFVYEVIMRRKSDSHGVHVWEDITPANDSNQKQSLFEEYYSGKNSSRLYRGRFEFSLCFHNWIDATDSFDQIQIRLKDQCDAIKRLKHWYTQGKIKVLNTDSSPSMLYFITTPDLFQEVYSHPGISSIIYDTEIVTLATI